MVDKYTAVVEWLMNCPSVKNNSTYFNFAKVVKDNTKQIVTVANDKILNQAYVDGGVLRRFTFTLIDYKSVAYRAIAKVSGASNEDIEDILQVQEIIDWVVEQAENRNYPDFGDDCIIDSLEPSTDTPNLNGVDTNATPALAKYSVSIQIQYLDTSKVLWNK